jgi:hypothetical protein
MFDVSISQPSAHQLWVAAAGKHVHANLMGDGGDLYFLEIALA